MALHKRLESVLKWAGLTALAAGMAVAASSPARADVDFRFILGIPAGIGIVIAPDHYYQPAPRWHGQGRADYRGRTDYRGQDDRYDRHNDGRQHRSHWNERRHGHGYSGDRRGHQGDRGR